MRTAEWKVTLLLLLAATGMVAAGQRSAAPRAAPPAARRAFEVVSVRRNMTVDVGSNLIEHPDGGFTMLNVPVTALIARAYPPALVNDMINLPRWAVTDRYDISATASAPAPTPDQRLEMLRTLLADRFKLAAHTERREQPAYDLVFARPDRRPGPDLKPSTVDCDQKPAAGRTAAASPAPAAGRGSSPIRGSIAGGAAERCVLLVNGGNVAGDTTMAGLAAMLGNATGRPVIDKTALKGSYHVTITSGQPAVANGAAAPPSSDSTPALLTAIETGLGLKLQPSTAMVEVLVVDRLERPSDN